MSLLSDYAAELTLQAHTDWEWEYAEAFTAIAATVDSQPRDQAILWLTGLIEGLAVFSTSRKAAQKALSLLEDE